MIAYLKGKLIFKGEKSCLITTAGGVGYEVFLSGRGMQELPDTGQELEVYIYTVVREDTLDLYGFFTREERETFSTLLSIPKLGPKLALAVLNCFSPPQLSQLVAREDEKALTAVPGIGAKSARRILLDLKDKLQLIPTVATTKPRITSSASVFDDAVAALVSLGYSAQEVTPVVAEILEQESDLDVAATIRQALKKMSKLVHPS
ncbi:Holliday junction branch migration protein RuvA [Desulfovulcanus sp.]